MAGPNIPQVNPAELLNEVRKIIVRQTGCNASWEQHPQPLTRSEIVAVAGEIAEFFERLEPGCIFEGTLPKE